MSSPTTSIEPDATAAAAAAAAASVEETKAAVPPPKAEASHDSPAATPSPQATASSAASPDAVPAESPAPASPSRRALTYEEFRQFYVASKRSEYARQTQPGDAVHHPDEVEEIRAAESAIEQERRRRLAAELCADLATLAQEQHTGVRRRQPPQRRYHGMGTWVGNADLHPGNQPPPPAPAAAAAAAPAPVPAAAPPPPPVAQPGVLARVGNAAGTVVSWVFDQICDNVVHLLQFALLGYLVYTQSDEGGSMVLMVMAIFAVFAVLRAVVRNFQIGHETGTVSAPSFLGRLFKPEGQTEPVSTPRKVGYMAAKCVEAFILSVFPTYSIERLEAELQVDGIVQ